jgi:hypothetical protein
MFFPQGSFLSTRPPAGLATDIELLHVPLTNP